jgi:hypothetical protein
MNSLDLDGAKTWVRSDQFRTIAIVVLLALALFIAFEAGSAFGFHRAAFGYHLDQNYGRTFGAPGRMMPGGHGATGTIVSIASSTLTVSTANGPEEQVTFDDDTAVRNQNAAASSSALSTGQSVVIFGEPAEDGSIRARLIRIIPAPAK